MDDSKKEAIYTCESRGVEESLVLSTQFSTTSSANQRFELRSELGAFVVIVSLSGGDYAFTIDSNESDNMMLYQFKHGTIKGDSGKVDIRVKDINAETFLRTLFFMYHGELEKPMDLTFDHTAEVKWSNWEGIYRATHRYRIDDLRKMALDKILGDMDKSSAIAFLFRSAYLFEELRAPLIKFVAKECHADIVQKETQERYMDHPEFRELLGELFEANHTLREE
ncbi:hypothetical protein BGZ82_011647 [Podila clonocystis]|nr:hypothetical protein BGZ82_011647 [Podila clonocystis]